MLNFIRNNDTFFRFTSLVLIFGGVLSLATTGNIWFTTIILFGCALMIICEF